MTVDSYKFVPRVLTALYDTMQFGKMEPIPWAPFAKPLSEATIGIITTGGLYIKDIDQPFDLEREKQEKVWGDPTYRAIPADTPADKVGISHLHINVEYAEDDYNVLLPLDRLHELQAAGRIARVAPTAYSFMGFQGYPPNTDIWENESGPQVIAQLKQEGVDAVIIAPA